MCGRTGVDAANDELNGYFGEVGIVPDLDGWFPPEEIFPSGGILTARALPGRGVVAQQARWGLAPSWWEAVDRPKLGERTYSTFNSRIEDFTKPTWRSAWAAKGPGAGRCLILATHWWEWTALPGQEGKTKPQKRRIRLTLPGSRVFAMAGLWSEYRGQLTSTIITCPPAPDIAWVHNRMPLVLHPSMWPAWFSGDVGPADLGPPPAGIVDADEDHG